MVEIFLSREENEALLSLRRKIPQPKRGLPDAVFDFALHIVPMMNVDLVVFDSAGRTLWSWRQDQYGAGWHIPGSIIRAEETIAERIAATAENELGAMVIAEPSPRALLQFFSRRGSFISLVYKCSLANSSATDVAEITPVEKSAGSLGWFQGVPHELYPAHLPYQKLVPVMAAQSASLPIIVTIRETADGFKDSEV